MYHYVYKLILPETSEYYFGSRTTKELPELDNYLGSMISWKIDKSKLIKEIIKSDFSNREECIKYERNLILVHKNDILNRNAHVPGIGFHTLNLQQYVDETGKVYRLNKNDEFVNSFNLKPFWSGKKHTEEAKNKMSDSAKNRKINEKNEELRRIKISKKMSGRKLSDNTKKKISESRIGDKNPYSKYLKENGIIHHASKKIAQYTINNEFIRLWDNASIAAKELNIGYKAINQCLRGKTKKSGGFIWRYEI